MKYIFSQRRLEKRTFPPLEGYKIRVSRLCCEKYSSQLVRNVYSDDCVCNTRFRLVLQTTHSPKSTVPYQLRITPLSHQTKYRIGKELLTAVYDRTSAGCETLPVTVKG